MCPGVVDVVEDERSGEDPRHEDGPASTTWVPHSTNPDHPDLRIPHVLLAPPGPRRPPERLHVGLRVRQI
jgi:hypothetical protein